MLLALIFATLMLVGLYLSPKVRTLTDKKPLQSVYHILTVMLILFGPSMAIMPILGVPGYVAPLTGKFFVYLSIPLLIFMGIKKLRERKKMKQSAVIP